MSTITTIQSTDAISASRSTINTNFSNLNTDKAELSGATFTGDISVPDEAYGVGWNGSMEVPTKNAVYDKIETMGGSGATTFLGLTDTPSSYSGQALKIVQVNAGATGLEFVTASGGGDALTTNPLSQFASTTSAQLAGVISDETGTGALVFANSPTLVTPALGTPASGTLTNCTGLPLAGVVDSTTEALGVGSLEIGHATDTTISRSSAGVIAVEGVVIPSVSSTNTLTNKRITQRVNQATNHTTSVTMDSDAYDEYDITAQAGALLFNNPSGTPTNCQKLMVRIKDNGTSRALTYGTQFASGAATLPTTTTISKKQWMGFEWDSTDSKWYLLATGVQP